MACHRHRSRQKRSNAFHQLLFNICTTLPYSSEQVESRKEKAVRFTDNVLGDPDRADEIEDESPESYAERKGIEITNPHIRRKTVARIRTKAELEAEIEELQQENQELQDQLD